MLTDHFIEIFRDLHVNKFFYTYLEHRPTEYRCHMLMVHLLIWEIHAMYYPELILIDVFDVLKDHGALFRTFFYPDGNVRQRDYLHVGKQAHDLTWRPFYYDYSQNHLLPPEIVVF